MLYAEDLAVGRVFPTGSWNVTAEDVKRVANEWDPVPLHVDEQAAAASPFGGLIASGLHTMAIANRLAWDRFAVGVALHAGREVRRVQMLKPVRPGTTLTGEIEIVEQRLRDDGRAVVAWQNQLVDDEGDPVLRFVVETITYRRPPAAEARPEEQV